MALALSALVAAALPAGAQQQCAYVVSQLVGRVSLIDTATNELLGTVPVCAQNTCRPPGWQWSPAATASTSPRQALPPP